MIRSLFAAFVFAAFATSAQAQDVLTITDPFSGQTIAVPALPDSATAHDARTHAAVGFLLAAHFADLATTMYVVGKGVGEEKNPALAPFQHNPIRFAMVKFGIAAGAVAGIFELHKSNPKLARWLAYAEGAATFAIAFRNQQLLNTTR